MKLRRRRLVVRIHHWIRRALFLEENWNFQGPFTASDFAGTIRKKADHGRPFLFSLPRLPFNRLFIGRVTPGHLSLKRRTHPLIWPITPGTYYFSGRILADSDAGLVVEGSYRLRPVLALIYYLYFAVGSGLLGLSVLAALLGAGMWIFIDGIGASVFLSGLQTVVVSLFFAGVGIVHIVVEKWLDRGNRRAVKALIKRAVGS